MDVVELSVPGALLIRPRLFADGRGTFCEWYRNDALERALGRPLDLAQANCSVSRHGTLRGIHYSDLPPGQAKYVTCVRGAVLDVVVDLRVGSPTFGRWEAVRLDDTRRHAVHLAEGLGHAFAALTDDATVVYLCSSVHAPDREHGITPMDDELAITWPSDVAPVLSAKDAAAPTLAQARAAGLLPRWEDCLTWYDRPVGVS